MRRYSIVAVTMSLVAPLALGSSACSSSAEDQETATERVDDIAAPLSGPSFRSLGSPAGGSSSMPWAVSADGSVIVGTYLDAAGVGRAFRWTESAGFQDLGAFDPPGSTGETEARFVSADGSAVYGYSRVGGWAGTAKTFKWTASTGLVAYGPASGNPMGGSSDGSVLVGDLAGQGFRWTAAGGMQTITDPNMGTGYATAASTDGNTATGASGLKMFRWTASGGRVMLGTLGTCTHSVTQSLNTSVGTAISADGSIVVGRSTIASNVRPSSSGYCVTHATRWTASTGLRDLGVLGTRKSSWADGISADGSIITGSASDPVNRATTLAAFVWRSSTNRMEDLKQILSAAGVTSAASFTLGYGWTKISADGTTIIGQAMNPATNRIEAYRAVIGAGGVAPPPPPPPPSCVPTTCAAQGKNCGSIADGCGGTLSCGTCSSGTCGGGGVANVCGGSAPACVARGGACTSSSQCCGGRSCRSRNGSNICD